MDENQKAKMEAMKKQIQRKKQEQELLNNSLYQECLTALKDYVIVQDETDIRYLTSLVSSNDIESHSHCVLTQTVPPSRRLIKTVSIYLLSFNS